MTREEAIAVLEKEASIIYDNSIEMTIREWAEFDDLKRDAISVAIEALSAEAVQGCDGCIHISPFHRLPTREPQKQCLRCKRYWRDRYERKGGE